MDDCRKQGLRSVAYTSLSHWTLTARVVYGGGLGPFDFKPAKLEKAVEQYITQIDRQPV